MKRLFPKLLLLSIALSSCDSSTMNIDTEKDLPAEIEMNFYHRYPDASISHFENFNYDNTTRISFEENDGLQGTAIYQNGSWMMTQKEYDYENFLFEIPRKVIRTYLGTGVPEEEFLSDWDYIVEISRIGFDQKQYEFHFTTPFTDETGTASHLVNSIIISEDGSLLTFDHSYYNRSIWWYDMRESHRCVRERYPSASMLGAVNKGGDNILFIKDDGILKTVTTKENGSGFEWKKTQYQLDINTRLPEYVESNKKTYETQHPDKPFFRLLFIETTSGSYYRLGFGSEMDGHYVDVETE